MKRFVILAAVIVAIVVLWAGAWLVVAGLVKSNVAALADADGVTSPRVTCETLNVGGFPFRFDLDCGKGRMVNGDIVADIEGLRATALVYRPTHLVVSGLGPVNVVDAFTGSQSKVEFSSLEGSARLEGWRIGRVSLVGKDVLWSDTLWGGTMIAQSPSLEVHLLDIPEQHDPEKGVASLAGYIKADALDFPGLTIAAGNAEVEVEISALPDDVRDMAEPGMVQRWQAAGGQLKIVSVRGTDATSSLNASGVLGLDEAGHVRGQITIDSTGVAERIGPLLAEPYRTLVLGNAKPDGTFANQLNFRDGGIYSGLIPIAAMPPLY